MGATHLAPGGTTGLGARWRTLRGWHLRQWWQGGNTTDLITGPHCTAGIANRGHGTRRDLCDNGVAGHDGGMVGEHPWCHHPLHLPHRSLLAVREDQGRGGLVSILGDTSEASAWAGTWMLLLCSASA